MCDYCDKSEGNKPLLDHGTCKAEIYHDGYDWMLSVTARTGTGWKLPLYSTMPTATKAIWSTAP